MTKPIPNDLYLVCRKQKMLGHHRNMSGSLIFAFTSRDDACIVKKYTNPNPKFVRQKNDSYHMIKQNPIVPCQVTKTDVTNLFTYICTSGIKIAIVSSVYDTESHLELNCSHEAEAEMDSGVQVAHLEKLYFEY
jgi:hypothetical protein